MIQFICRRLVHSIPVVLGVSFVVFVMTHLVPGDPIMLLLGTQSEADAKLIQQLREEYGFDKPIPVQYVKFLTRALQGDLGRSIHKQSKVIDEIRAQIFDTIQLTATAMSIAISIGVVLGIISSIRQNSWMDNVSMLFAVTGVAMPSFWLALLLIFVFSLRLGWLPATGSGDLERLILPAVALGYDAAAIIARLTRSSMLEILRQEYMVTARAKGLSEWFLISKHAVKNAMIPVVTVLGLQFGRLLGGTVVIETVFARPGLGRLAVGGILEKDFPVVQGTVLVAALCYVLVNLLVDITYSFLDPRIQYER
jgi:ABC-type dipeptide/oligopeptide/nickel transport system permease component